MARFGSQGGVLRCGSCRVRPLENGQVCRLCERLQVQASMMADAQDGDSTPIEILGREIASQIPAADITGTYRRIGRRQNISTVLVAIVAIAGGAATSWFTLKDRVGDNERAVIDTVERQSATEDEVGAIEERVDKVEGSLTMIEQSQTAISDGIDQLKKENVKKLEDELAAAKRELRREKRRRQD